MIVLMHWTGSKFTLPYISSFSSDFVSSPQRLFECGGNNPTNISACGTEAEFSADAPSAMAGSSTGLARAAHGDQGSATQSDSDGPGEPCLGASILPSSTWSARDATCAAAAAEVCGAAALSALASSLELLSLSRGSLLGSGGDALEPRRAPHTFTCAAPHARRTRVKAACESEAIRAADQDEPAQEPNAFYSKNNGHEDAGVRRCVYICCDVGMS
jgi:hypothetical protein